MIKLIPGTNLVDLTRDNVAIVTAMISTDSAYRIAADKKAGPTKTYYGLPERNLRDYPEYQEAIMDIILQGSERISRNGFDQLIWYYYKSRI